MATVAEVIDSRAFSDFCGVESSNQVPDGDTLWRFRNILMRNGIQQELFAQVVELLMQRGLVHTVKVTAAYEHDVMVTSELLSGDEEEVYGDSGYLGAEI